MQNAKDFQTYFMGMFQAQIQNSIFRNENEIIFEINKNDIELLAQYVFTNLGYPLILLFATDERQMVGDYYIHYVFADRMESFLVVFRMAVSDQDPIYPSITTKIYAADLYEREIHDLFGLTAIGHPELKRLVFHHNWPKEHYPLRKDFNKAMHPPVADEKISFSKVAGNGVYEVPVGPVHAGIIEPGHFRFSVSGEPIIHLEAQLYYVHKGIEKMCEGWDVRRVFFAAERISGDETFSNSLAYCQAIEKIAKVILPDRALFMRVLFSELERLTSHLGDLAGVCLDVAFSFAAYQFRMMRGWAYQIADELCGMRFLRSVNCLGGIRADFVRGKEQKVIMMLNNLKTELLQTQKIVFENTMLQDRVENTGVLKKRIAMDLNVVGPAARASGLCEDVRKAFPYAAYGKLDFEIPKHNNGDVNCRMHVKLEECLTAIDLMISSICSMPAGEYRVKIDSLPPYQSAFGMTESARGENIHFVMTGENDTIERYKVRTPSFCNWPAVCHAVKGNIVPDFPLINKSFNLSYAGNDL